MPFLFWYTIRESFLSDQESVDFDLSGDENGGVLYERTKKEIGFFNDIFFFLNKVWLLF